MREHDTVAVGYDTAIRNDRHDRDPVGLGERLIMGVLKHLQVEKAREESAERNENHEPSDAETAAKVEAVAIDGRKIRSAAERAEAAISRRKKRSCHGVCVRASAFC